MTRKGESIETKSRGVVSRGWSAREMGMTANWYGGDEGDALELDRGDAHTTLSTLKATTVFTLKWLMLCLVKCHVI